MPRLATHYWTRILLAGLLFGVTPLPSDAGPKEFFSSLAGLLDQTNQSMAEAGKKLKEGIKEGGIQKGMEGFDQGLKDMEKEMEPKRAAFFASLSDLPMWIPNAIKKTWDDFVGALRTCLDLLRPNGGDAPPTPPADDPAPPADDPAPPADDPAPPADDPAPPADDPAPPADDPAPPADDPAPPADDPAPPADDPAPPADDPAPPADDPAPPADDPAPPADDPAPPADEPAPPADDPAPPAEEPAPPADGGAESEAVAELAPEGPAAPRASQDDPWASVKQDFLAADRTMRFETFGRVGTLLMAEQRKQKRGKESGALDERTLQTLTDKLDPVRKLLAWMGGHLSEELATGEGYPALQSQLQIIGPKASLQVFGEVIRTARRRAQRPDAQGAPRDPVSADRLEQIQSWLEGSDAGVAAR